MRNPVSIPFQEVIDALLDESTRLKSRYLYRLSDLIAADKDMLSAAWDRIPLWRRQALVEDLERLGESDDVLSFEAVGRIAIHDEDALVRQLAVRILMEFEERDLIPLYTDLMSRDPNSDVRAVAASGLGIYVYLGEIEELPRKVLEKIESNLLKVYHSQDVPLVRRRALEALGFSSREEIFGLIDKAYESGEQDWLVSALFAMGRSANEVWHPKVTAMLEHSLPLVRFEAVRAAGELDIKATRQTLLNLLEDDNEDVRLAAILSLSQIGGEGVREQLTQLLRRTRNREDREYLEEALDNLSLSEEMDFFIKSDLEADSDETDLLELEDLNIADVDEEDWYEEDDQD